MLQLFVSRSFLANSLRRQTVRRFPIIPCHRAAIGIGIFISYPAQRRTIGDGRIKAVGRNEFYNHRNDCGGEAERWAGQPSMVPGEKITKSQVNSGIFRILVALAEVSAILSG